MDRARGRGGWAEIYFDDLGLLVQADGDGGDTAQREGWMWFGIWLRGLLNLPWSIDPPISLEDALAFLEMGTTGQFRRHPTQGGWKSDPDQFSRDQLTPLVAAMGVWGQTERLRRSWAAMRQCNLVLMCVQGTKDVVGPDLVNLYYRGWGQTPDPTGDAFLTLGVANRLAQSSHDPDDVGDDLNLIVHLLMSLIASPSSVTENAAFAYAKNRPVCHGCYLEHYRNAYPDDFTADPATMAARIDQGIQQGWTTDCTRVLGALRWYFRIEAGGAPALAELYEPLIKRYLS